MKWSSYEAGLQVVVIYRRHPVCRSTATPSNESEEYRPPTEQGPKAEQYWPVVDVDISDSLVLFGQKRRLLTQFRLEMSVSDKWSQFRVISINYAVECDAVTCLMT